MCRKSAVKIHDFCLVIPVVTVASPLHGSEAAVINTGSGRSVALGALVLRNIIYVTSASD